ncbi:MAG: ribosomal-processing cysteine protease Prp [Spirochaetes bacterium]|nr:ribosomal-processing cysteine protease Prp [Spirochaetota bacterium]
MITVTYHNIQYDDELRCDLNGSGIIKVRIEGHALFSPEGTRSQPHRKAGAAKGYNLICAAISFSALTLLRSITIIAGINPDYTINEGLMEFWFHGSALNAEQKTIIRVLLESFLIGMLDMRKKYPDEIAIQTVAQTQ